jgi:predicted ATPase
MLTTLAISGYRSLRDVRLELDMLNVVTGANGSGKSSLYRSLRLLAQIAHGGIIRAIASVGGLSSTLWAGPEKFSRAMKAGHQPVQGLVRKEVISLKLGFSSEDYGYAIDLGLPKPSRTSLFARDPQIKTESVWAGQVLKVRNEIARRNEPLVRVRDASHTWKNVLTNLSAFDSMMTHASDPQDAAELLYLRDLMRSWRFYDHFRTDREAPLRLPQIGTYTPVLANDGTDLAAAVQTILEIGEPEELHAAIEDAFPGSHIAVATNEGYFELVMHQKGLLRPLKTAELSDGTLRYLLLIAALLSPRPPTLMVLNEPEMSLHPDLLEPLGRLIALASRRSQVIVVSHADELVTALEGASKTNRIVLQKELGETHVFDREGERADRPDWEWPAR